MNLKFRVLVMILVSMNILVSSNERSVSTSTIEMAKLLQTEEILVKALSSYADEVEKKLHTIRSAVEKISEEIEKSKPNVEAYLANPLNAFSLVRRMHADWLKWIDFIKRPTGIEHIDMLRDELFKVQPTETDLVEAVTAIERIRETYDLEVADIAAGLLNGKQYDVKLSTLDVFTIGYELYKQSNYFEASFWIYEALDSFEEDDINDAIGVMEEDILRMYAENLIKLDRLKDAVIILDILMDNDPTDMSSRRRKAEIEIKENYNITQSEEYTDSSPSVYELGCRGYFPYRTNSLHCRYNTTTNPFLILAPIKMEEISLDPYMVLYYDVMSDDEIEHLKEIGKPILERAQVINETDNSSHVNECRTSQYAFFEDDETDVMKRVNQRIADMTGFDITESEQLQLGNYILGGHYDIHSDYFSDDEYPKQNSLSFNNRISTLMFYMSDVEQGGATVFPELKIAVFPTKGSAVMWYNLNDRGECDPRTIHAGCPVIVGSKWVCNKWIQEREQWRARPCLKK